jgi:hypothetical protein
MGTRGLVLASLAVGLFATLPLGPGPGAADTAGLARLEARVVQEVSDWFRVFPETHTGYAPLPARLAGGLERGRPLPPGASRKLLPKGLMATLPPPPLGYARFMVGQDLVLIYRPAGLVADIARVP